MTAKRLQSVLLKIGQGKMTRAAAADALGCGVRHVNRLMKAHDVSRPASKASEERAERADLAEERRRMRADNADCVIAARQSLAEAAVNAGCSERTMYRWIKKREKRAEKSKKRTRSR